MNIKKRIKRVLPERIIYLYSVMGMIIPYYKAKRTNKHETYPQIKFYSNVETINNIVGKRMSLARFGDGELSWMNGEDLKSFQCYSNELANDLICAFKNQNEKLLVGIPYGIVNSDGCNLQAKMHWEIIKSRLYKKLDQFIDYNRTYSDASITRPYIDYRNREYSSRIFHQLKRIWEKRNVIIVEGYKTKLGMGNDLLNNALSIRRILCPSENAYHKIDIIEECIIKHAQRDDLILGALGPTASILASRLCNLSYQFIDIGHIDLEYMWYIKKTLFRVPIEGKYVNEIGSRECSNSYEDYDSYKNSIIDRL